MTNEDREMLISLRQQQTQLQQMLERLTSQLVSLEARTGSTAAELLLPPVPPEAFLPPVPHTPEAVDLPPLPTADEEVTLPPVPFAAQPARESQSTRWFLRIGAGLAILFLLLLAGSLDVSLQLDARLGLLGRFGLLGLGSMVVLFLGSRLDRSTAPSLVGRLLLVTGLLGLYVAFYEVWQLTSSALVPHPLIGGDLLFVWTFYALYIAERRKSQLIGTVGLVLGYFSMALNSVTAFSMGADLILAATAAAFLLSYGWTTLATFGAIGTYFAMFHRLVFDSYGDLVLDTSRTLPFLPPAVYLVGAWSIFTAAIILCTAPEFRGGRRFFFTSLNNAAVAFLLALSAYISGYGLSSIGLALLDTGIGFLVISRFAGFAQQEPVDLMGTYAAHGLALFTAGVILLFTGVTRALMLLLETLLLGIAGAFAGDRVLITATYAAGFFATVFCIWQMAIFAHHPWLLGIGGALIMLINAWSCRGDVRHSPVARSSTVFATSCYCLLALALIFAALSSELTDATLPVALALGALALTFAIYQVSIFELPSLAQILMLAALVLVLFPVETGEELPGWTIALVGLSTLTMLTWWARQRLTKPGPWIGPLSYIYSFALVYLTVLTIQPYLGAQNWMVAESFLAVLFLLYGALFRVWPLAIAGQSLLVLSLWHVFFPPQDVTYPWSAIAAAVPIFITYLIGRAAHRWLHLFPELSDETKSAVSFFATVYKLIALLGVIRWTFAIVPAPLEMPAFFFLGAFLLGQNIRHSDSFGLRCGLLLSAVGIYLCAGHQGFIGTLSNAFAVLLFVAQAPILIAAAPALITRLESWVVTIATVFIGWYFVSLWTWHHPHGTHSHISHAWALFALFLFLLGLFTSQARLRWCGLVVLCATILRVLSVDLWTLPIGLRLLTIFLLAIITLGIAISFFFRNSASPENSSKNL